MILTWLACSSATSPEVTTEETPAPSVYAVGDLHGDLDNAIRTLQLAGLVDAEGRWTGGAATLVQTGDVVDRGPDGRALYGWLRRLTAEASAVGGRVVPLLGNHEVMNLRGDWRYVAPGDVAAYGGIEARKAAFAPAGEDGRWLRSLGAAAAVGETVFVHGGIRAAEAARGVAAINTRVRAALDVAGESAAIGVDGPLWYRGYADGPEDVACPELNRALAALGARRMVVGHTTRRDGKIQARCGGALLVIDIGIADDYGAHLGLVELTGGTDALALYPGGREDLPDP
jgi:Calcineurin-like phosphoesterase